LFEERDVFNLRMALECNDGVFHLHLTRVEDGVVYFRLQDAHVQLRRGSQGSDMEGQEEGQPAATQPLSPGAEGEGVEPPRSPRKKAARAKR
jgi:hypothetical protein